MKSEMTRSRFASCQTHMDAGDMPLFHSVCVVGCVVGNLPAWVISPWKSYLGTTLELIWTDTLSVSRRSCEDHKSPTSLAAVGLLLGGRSRVVRLKARVSTLCVVGFVVG